MLEHGGNLTQAMQQYGIALDSWLDSSTGINPNHYPIPNIPISAWQRLPEDHDGLIEAACHYYGCATLLPAAGSQAVLQVLPKLRPPCRVAMPSTMYQEHAYAWQQHGHNITFFDGTPDDNLLKNTDVLLLCNPNNPTGQCFSKDQLLQWHHTLNLHGAWLIVDEAFMDVTPERSIAAHTHLQGLLVLRSLGKFFGLAGARVGFLLANQTLLNQAQEILGPWSLSGASRYIAKVALLDITWQSDRRTQLNIDGEKLKLLLTQYGLKPSGGTALFQYVKIPQAIKLHEVLAQHGVWVRLFNDEKSLRFGLPPDDGWSTLEAALSNLGLSIYKLNLGHSTTKV